MLFNLDLDFDLDLDPVLDLDFRCCMKATACEVGTWRHADLSFAAQVQVQVQESLSFATATLEQENLGKPLNQYRIRGLVLAPDDRIYGIGGDDDESARLLSYNPSRGAYEMLRMIEVNRRPYYTWHAWVIDSLVVGNDGTKYLGQSERRSKLSLYQPEIPRRAPER